QQQAGGEVGARRAAVTTPQQFLQQPGGGHGLRIGHFDYFVDDLEQEAGFDPRPSDAFDDRRARRPGRAVVALPATRERRARWLGHAQPRVQAAIAQVAADRCRGAALACAAIDPLRLLMLLSTKVLYARLHYDSDS